jgi:NADPH:quinone reductase-like Zn-dependent oxidoreductase
LVATGHGTLAEFVSVPASLVAVVPAGWDMAAAAGLGIVGQTAHIALVQAVGLGRGSRVLVNGASGGLGSMLAQVCKGKGAWVVGICSGGNGELVKGFGADEVCFTSSSLLFSPFLEEEEHNLS